LQQTIIKRTYIGDAYVVPGVQCFIGANGTILYFADTLTTPAWVTVNGSTGAWRLTYPGTTANTAANADGSRFKPLLLNPGNPNIEPWVANIAKNYRYWKLTSPKLEFRSNCVSVTTGSIATGNIQMVAVIDANNADPRADLSTAGGISSQFPTTKQQLEQYAGCRTMKPQQSGTIMFPAKRRIHPMTTLNIAPTGVVATPGGADTTITVTDFRDLSDMEVKSLTQRDYNAIWPGGFIVAANKIPGTLAGAPSGTNTSGTITASSLVSLGELWMSAAWTLVEPAPVVS